MPNVTVIDSLQNRLLTNVAQGYIPDGFICDRVAPPVSVLDKGGKYLKLANGLIIYDTERALNAKSKQIDFDYSSDTYALTEHALAHLLDKEVLASAEQYGIEQVVKVKETAAKTLTRMLLAAKEKTLADIVFATGYYNSSNRVALSSTTCWSDYTNSDPIAQIQTGRNRVRTCTGVYPNTMVLGATSYDILKWHPDLLGYFKNQMGALTMEQMKSVLELDQIIVGTGVWNNGGTMTDFWGDSAALLPVPTAEQLADGYPAFVLNFNLINGLNVLGPIDEGEVERYIEKQWWQLKAVNELNGYLITNTVA